ncbi:hypothetical protein BJV74DRAFT_81587 [Russula compacta]|nr:hypothetical protein BJV74DRAFT_81587 [Russula compacta]
MSRVGIQWRAVLLPMLIRPPARAEKRKSFRAPIPVHGCMKEENANSVLVTEQGGAKGEYVAGHPTHSLRVLKGLTLWTKIMSLSGKYPGCGSRGLGKYSKTIFGDLRCLGRENIFVLFLSFSDIIGSSHDDPRATKAGALC